MEWRLLSRQDARAKVPRWTISALKRLAERHERVRISGWLMFDGEHPDQIGKTRGTLWEIHPVMPVVELFLAWLPWPSRRLAFKFLHQLAKIVSAAERVEVFVFLYVGEVVVALRDRLRQCSHGAGSIMV